MFNYLSPVAELRMKIFILIFSLLCCIALSSATCQRLFVNKVSPEETKTIVDKHNQLRSLISQGKVPGQPKGVNLATLKWDPALAKEAQKIANTCVFAHVSVKDPRWYVGQNLGKSWSSAKSGGADWNGIIQSWFNEYKNFKYPSISNGVTGHYTQVVWATTKYIGCGYTFSLNNGWYEKLYVCNYGPGGNIIGQAPYKKA